MEGYFKFQWEGGCFSNKGASFLRGGAPHGGHQFWSGCEGFQKNRKMGGSAPPYGKP